MWLSCRAITCGNSDGVPRPAGTAGIPGQWNRHVCAVLERWAAKACNFSVYSSQNHNGCSSPFSFLLLFRLRHLYVRTCMCMTVFRPAVVSMPTAQYSHHPNRRHFPARQCGLHWSWELRSGWTLSHQDVGNLYNSLHYASTMHLCYPSTIHLYYASMEESKCRTFQEILVFLIRKISWFFF